MPQDCFNDRAQTVHADLTMTESADCLKRFQAAVDVIHSLPKNGAYRPSYEIMLRFYGLYKQAVCGPCKCSRPGFWDPVGRYKWDAWSRLGDMSCEAAMRAYVEEMKKVAQEVIDTMPVNEKTASLFHYFEPLYVVIHDMPQPPEALLRLRAEVEGTAQTVCPEEADPDSSGEELLKRLHVYPKKSSEIQEVERTAQTVCPEEADPDSGEESMRQEVYPRESIEIQGPAPEGLVVTSDSESDVFCDSLEQLDQNKGLPWSDALHNESVESSKEPGNRCCPTSYATQVGAGQGGEGSEDSSGPPLRGRGLGRETRHGRREERRGRSPGRLQRANRGVSGAGGRDGWEDGTNVSQNAHMQRQIVLALQRLREDMHSVMERLEAVERLAAAQTQSSEWRSLAQFRVPAPDVRLEAWWWPFGVSGRTALLLLLWPLVVHGLMFLLRRRHRKFYLPT